MTIVEQQSLMHLVIGVADMHAVRELWSQHFGMQVVAGQMGADPELERVWGLEPGQVVDQLLLATPGTSAGWLHFVQFAQPLPPVRRGAKPNDLCPKNIDVNCIDMPARKAELETCGLQFRSDISQYQIDDLTVREVQAGVHDEINMVLIEVLDDPIVLSPRHYGAVTSFVLTVPDIQAESAFYQDVLGLELVLQHRVAGEAIEKVVGLPSGAALLLRLMGCDAQKYGRVELIEYEGMTGADLYPRAQPPALGSLRGRFETRRLDRFVVHARELDLEVREHPVAELIFGRCRLVSVTTPAGFTLEIFERSSV